MPTSYPIEITESAKALVEAASLSLAEVEAQARLAIDGDILSIETPEDEKNAKIPSWGFHTFAMPNGTEFIAWFSGSELPVEIYAGGGYETAGPISEDTAEMLGIEPREAVFPVPPALVLDGLTCPRTTLPKTDAAGMRKWIATTDVTVLLSGEAIFNLVEEAWKDQPDVRFYLDKRRILAFFREWKDLGRPLSAQDLQGAFIDLVMSLYAPEE